MRIALDFHDTLAHLAGEWLRLLNKEKGTDFYVEDVRTWATEQSLPITCADFHRYLHEIQHDGGNVNLVAVKGAERAITELGLWNSLEIVSGAKPEYAPGIKAWLAKHGHSEIPVRTVPPGTAAEEKLALPFDIFIDDNPNMIGKVPLNKRLVLFDRPWNESVKPNGLNEWRAKTWDDVLEIVSCNSLLRDFA